MIHLAPRSQWAAIALLATLIFSILLVRFYRKDVPPSGIPPMPLILAVAGDVKKPGVFLMAGTEVTVSQAIEAAGGLRNHTSTGAREDFALPKLRNGQLLRVACFGPSSAEIHVEPMPAAARLTLGEKLDVNIASEEELMLVPQMKTGFAATIVNRRLRQAWQNLDELEEIPGVGPKTVEKWRSCLAANAKDMGGEHETER
jgi:DNA uptake protein ComE-like DNA-binding protein